MSKGLHIRGSVDGYGLSPFRLNGWAKAQGDDEALTIEARFEGKAISRCQPTVERSDIGGTHGFVLPIPREATAADDLFFGRIKVVAIHPQGQEVELPFFARFLDALRLVLIKSVIAALSEAERAKLLQLPMPAPGADPADADTTEILVPGAKPAPLSYFGIKPGVRSASKVAVVGHDGYMFVWQGGNNLQDMYAQDPASPGLAAEAEAWLDLFQTRADRFKALGVPWRQMIIPEKSSILPEKFPLPIPAPTPLMAAIEAGIATRTELSAAYVPVLQTFADSPQRLETCRFIDTHSTPFGAWMNFRALLDSLGLDRGPEVTFDRTAFFPGDLGGAFKGAPLREPLHFPALGPMRPLQAELRQTEAYSPPDGGHIGTRCAWENPGSVTPLRVMAFGNSFFERGNSAACLSWWAARWFRSFKFLWYPEIDYDLVAQERPDLVICQTIERFLPRLPET